MKVAVVGVGISGIITSIGLSENGHEVHLFEKTSSLGGKRWKPILKAFGLVPPIRSRGDFETAIGHRGIKTKG